MNSPTHRSLLGGQLRRITTILSALVLGGWTEQTWAYTTLTVDAGTTQGSNTIMAKHVSQGYSQEAAANTHGYWTAMEGRLKAMNVGLVRTSVGNFIEVSGGTVTSWGQLDTVVQSINNAGGSALLTFGIGDAWPRDTANNANLTALVTAVVNRYKAMGVQYWEVYNEPDNPKYSKFANVAAYNAYYNVVAPAIRAADANAKIGGPALAELHDPAIDGATDTWMQAFFDNVNAAPVKPLNFVSWHFYSNGQGPHNHAHSKLGDQVDKVRSWLTTRSLSAEVMITEFNLSAEMFSKSDENDDAAHVADLVGYISKRFAATVEKPDNPIKLFFFAPKDSIYYNTGDLGFDNGTYTNNMWHVTRFLGGYSMLSYDNHPKPVYNALQLYTTMPANRLNAFLPASPPAGVGVWASKGSGWDSAGLLEVLAWNNSDAPQDVEVYSYNIPFNSSTVKEYTRVDLDERNGNAVFNVLNAESSLADLDPAASGMQKSVIFSNNGTSYRTPVFTLKPHSVCKVVIKPASAALPAAPTGVAAAADFQKIVVSWNAVAGAACYNVKRDTSSTGSFATVVGANIPGKLFIDDQANYNTNYYYKVEAVNNAGAASSAATAAAKWTYTGIFQSAPVAYINRFDNAGDLNQLSNRIGTWAIQNGQLVETHTAVGNYSATLPGVTLGEGTVDFDLKIDGASGWGGIELNNGPDTYKMILFAHGQANLYKNGAQVSNGQSNTNVYPRDDFQNIRIYYSVANKKIKVFFQGTEYFEYTATSLTPVTTIRLIRDTAFVVRYDNLQVRRYSSFLDPFSNVGMANWKAVSGSWSVVSGAMQQSTTSGAHAASCGLVHIQNGTVEADVRILATSGTHWAGLSLKRTHPEDGVWTSDAGYIVYLKNNGSVGLYNNLTNSLIGSEVSTGTNPAAGPVRLKVAFEEGTKDGSGNTIATSIKVYVGANATPYITANNNRSFTSGSTALVTSNCSATFDNFQVSK